MPAYVEEDHVLELDAAGWSSDADDANACDGDHLAGAPAAFRVLTRADVDARRQNAIERVVESLAVSDDVAETLLGRFRWRPADLQDAFLTDPDLVRGAAPASNGNVVVCGTAYCGPTDPASSTTLSCGHTFCNDCWTGLVRSAFSKGRSCIYTKCPGGSQDSASRFVKCHLQVPSRLFLRFLTPAGATKYRRWLGNAFVEGSRALKWCIRPSCEFAVECGNPGEVITCLCKASFCFGCELGDHRPAPCDLVTRWLARTQSDAETSLWIRSRTKACPNCNIRIEKNKACNHMICSNCAHHFCWLCKKSWSSHDVERFGFYRCNIYEADSSVANADGSADESADATQQLQKYLFYFNRYMHQVQAEKEIVRIRERFDGGTDERLLPVVESLEVVRRGLSWTYCLAYYMEGGPRKRLLEHQQGVLESLAEKLQGLLAADEMGNLDDIVRIGGAVRHFGKRVFEACGEGDDGVRLLSEADDEQEMWACTICTSELPDASVWCTTCGACRKHSEQECRVPNCKNPTTPPAVAPGDLHPDDVVPNQAAQRAAPPPPRLQLGRVALIR